LYKTLLEAHATLLLLSAQSSLLDNDPPFRRVNEHLLLWNTEQQTDLIFNTDTALPFNIINNPKLYEKAKPRSFDVSN
jgi:hypothetical protein